jgi:hypothetical protein
MRGAWIIALAAGLAVAGPAAAQARFAGTWTIAGASVAPWARDPKDAQDAAEARRLVGRTVRFGKDALAAPEPLGCKRPSYEFREAEPDTLFEGGLEHDGADRPLDAVAQARKLGITARRVTGMTASCSEVEFFLTAPDTVLFGLDNRIYALKRKR